MNRFALTIAALALIASASQACPFGRRSSCSSSTKVTYVQCSQTSAATDSAPVAQVKHESAQVPGYFTPSCPNGKCNNQVLQVGPTRGSFRLFR